MIFFTLTALLALVAGLITHFDALSHAAGLPVTDKSISGVIPLWVVTALRAIAVIGFLLASRLKQFSFVNALRQEWSQASVIAPQQVPPDLAPSSLDYAALATALVEAMQHAEALTPVRILEEETASLPLPSSQEASSSHPQLDFVHFQLTNRQPKTSAQG